MPSTPPGRTLTVLGCDGSFPGPGGAASGYLVEAAGARLWLDAGPGTFANLQRLSDPAGVDAVVLSHEHPDHWTDVESFCVWLRLAGRPPVDVHAPPGLRRRSYFADDPHLRWHELEPGGALAVGPLHLEAARTDHGPITLALRLEAAGGPALAYSADTGGGWHLGELGPGLGTVLCEATYTVAEEGTLAHLSGRQAGRQAAEAGAARLVCTHRWPTVSPAAVRAEAEGAFGGPVTMAEIGAVIAW